MGKSITITRQGQGNHKLCDDCTYYILFSSEETTAKIAYGVQTWTKEIEIGDNDPEYSTISPDNKDQKHCYVYNFNEEDKSRIFLVTTALFSGRARVYINYDHNPLSQDINNFDNFQFEKDITAENTFELKQAEFKKKVFFCFKALDEFPAYYINVNFLDEVESNQEYNFLINGNTINLIKGINLRGFLPAHNVTKYKLVDFNIKSDVKLNLKTFSAEPKLFVYYAVREFKNDSNTYMNETRVQDLCK